MAPHRINITFDTTDYPWPFTARLEAADGGEWVEVDRADGDTPDDALSELRALAPAARGVTDVSYPAETA